jgi:siroheme synthase
LRDVETVQAAHRDVPGMQPDAVSVRAQVTARQAGQHHRDALRRGAGRSPRLLVFTGSCCERNEVREVAVVAGQHLQDGIEGPAVREVGEVVDRLMPRPSSTKRTPGTSRGCPPIIASVSTTQSFACQ